MTVKIRGVEWTVLWVKKSSEKLFYDDTQCLGVTYFDERVIYLDRGLSGKSFEKTVVHELVHAFLYEYDIDLEDADKAVEEIVCDFIGARIRKISKLASRIVKAWKLEAAIKSLI